jgi:GIY-YIG catalytic domain
MWYVYFLEVTNGNIYAGSTNDLQRRFAFSSTWACFLDEQIHTGNSPFVHRCSE